MQAHPTTTPDYEERDTSVGDAIDKKLSEEDGNLTDALAQKEGTE